MPNEWGMDKMGNKEKYPFLKKELSKLLKETNLVSFYNDKKIIDKIVDLLMENKSINKISGIILTSEIQTYGGSISEEESTKIFEEIMEWWNATKDFIE